MSLKALQGVVFRGEGGSPGAGNPRFLFLAPLPLIMCPCPQGRPELSSPSAVGPAVRGQCPHPLRWTLPLGWPQASLSRTSATASPPGAWRLTPFYSAHLASAPRALTSALVSKSLTACPAAVWTAGATSLSGGITPCSVTESHSWLGQSLGVSGRAAFSLLSVEAGSLLPLLSMIDCYLKY